MNVSTHGAFSLRCERYASYVSLRMRVCVCVYCNIAVNHSDCARVQSAIFRISVADKDATRRARNDSDGMVKCNDERIDAYK